MRSLRHKLTHSTLHACLKGGFALVAFIGMAGQAIAQIHSAPLGTPTEVMVAEPSAAASSATDATAEITITGGQVSESGANLFHEFEQFNIETGQTASFVTAPEIQNVLSLITGGPSTIDGLLQVLGSQADLYLINPAGILFGPNVQLNLPGNFTANTATSLEFDDQWLNFMTAEAVDYSAFSGTPSAYEFSDSGAVINTGALTLSAGQSLSLMGSTVVNTGTIFAPGGNITLTAIEGEQVVRLNPGNQLLSLEVSAQSLSHNGPIPQTLSELLTGTSADIDTLTTHADGTVSLSSTGSILPENTGTAVVSGSVSTTDDTGGTIDVFGSQVALLEAQLSSTGDFGGGRLRLGGDAQGSLLAPTARRTYVGPNSVVSADARDRGNGGQIYIWSEDATDFYGALSAQGGRSSGDGGFAEISGKHNLAYGGSVDLSAPQGALGTLLFDPKTITILSGDGTNAPVFPRLPDLLNSPSNGSESFTIYERTLERLSPDANITLQATIDIMIDSLEDGVLSLQPGSNLIIQSDINDNGTGIFKMNSSDTIAAPGGSVTITSGEDSRTTVVGNIDLSGEGGEASEGGEGSQIFIDDASGISVGRLNAGEDGLIQLTSNNIELSAGQNSILASKVELSSATTAAGTGDIYLGSDVAHPDALDISRSDLQALGDLARLDIVPGDENRRLFISENIADGMSGELAVPVYIQGDRTTLVGPDFDNIWTLSAPSNGDGTSTLSGYSNLFFDNIQGLEGGELDDTVIFNSNSFEGPINGKSGDLTLMGNSFNLNSQISGTEKLSIQSISDEQEIWLGDSEGDLGGADTLDLGRFELANIADTFTSITIGDQDSGAIRLLDDIAFNSSLVLRSGETITTTGSTLSVDNGGTLTLEANTLSAGDLKTQGGDISLVGLFTSTQIDDESAEKADSPGIVAGRVQSQGGDISLVSPGRIEVISLDASGQRVLLDDDSLLEMPGGNISVETEGYFQATGYAPSVLNQSILFDSTAPDFPAEESTFESAHSVQTTEGALITIRHGGNAEVPFTVGEDSLHGSVGTLSNQASTISAGAYLGPYGVGDIQLITEAVPEVEPPVAEVPVTEVPVAEVPEVVTPIARLPAKPSAPSLPAVPILDERSGNRSSLDAVLVNSEAETSREAFSRIESAASTQFAQFLALSDRTQTQKVATLAEVQNTLKEARLNLEITPALVYVYFVPSAASPASVAPDSEEINAFQQVGHSDDQLEVMLIPPSGDPIRRRQWGVTRAQVEEVAQSLRFQATNAMSRKGDYLAPAQQLYQWMLGSLEPEFAQLGIDNLAFIMDDGLRTLPIAALHDGDRFLVEKYSLGLMPTFSLTDLESASSDRWRERSTSEVLAMGASRFSSQPPLPAVEAELEMIAEELWSGEAFLNESFTLENLKTQLAQDRYSMLHLATHAVFNSGDWDNSYIQLWDEKVSLNQINELGLSEQEIELIILSACNTALGDLNSEYGFAGFAVNAGSEAALASLWPVSDEGTLGFMSQFYRQMAAGNLRSQSLRQAQISLLQGNVSIFNGELIGPDGTVLAVVPELAESGNWDFSHPFYWSAFTMIGNPW